MKPEPKEQYFRRIQYDYYLDITLKKQAREKLEQALRDALQAFRDWLPPGEHTSTFFDLIP